MRTRSLRAILLAHDASPSSLPGSIGPSRSRIHGGHSGRHREVRKRCCSHGPTSSADAFNQRVGSSPIRPDRAVFVGLLANVNVARRMVIGDLNAEGRSPAPDAHIGRHRRRPAPPTDAHRGASGNAGLMELTRSTRHRRRIYSLTRQAIKGPAVTKGRTLYIYPERVPTWHLLHRTGAGQQVDPFIPWLMQTTGAEAFLPAVG